MTIETFLKRRTALALVIRREASALVQARIQRMRQDSPSCCPRCAANFTCGVVAGRDTCWCVELPPLALAKTSAAACYCPQCLRDLLNAQSHPA